MLELFVSLWLMRVEPMGVREVSSYTVGRPEETDDTPCLGAWGDDLCALAKQGIRTCASNEFRKDTLIMLGDDMRCVVKDRMNSRYRNRIDVADYDYEASRRFGVHVLPISILK